MKKTLALLSCTLILAGCNKAWTPEGKTDLEIATHWAKEIVHVFNTSESSWRGLYKDGAIDHSVSIKLGELPTGPVKMAIFDDAVYYKEVYAFKYTVSIKTDFILSELLEELDAWSSLVDTEYDENGTPLAQYDGSEYTGFYIGIHAVA